MKHIYVVAIWIAGLALNNVVLNIQDDGLLILYGAAIGALCMAVQV